MEFMFFGCATSKKHNGKKLVFVSFLFIHIVVQCFSVF